MCGNIGVAGDLDLDAMEAVKDLLFFDQVRGHHGTGLAFVPWAISRRAPESTSVVKMPIPATQFLENKAVASMLKTISHSVVIGHNRHATLGEHTHENTHPFISAEVVGAHNGTVHNKIDLVHKKDMSGVTDSEAILKNIGLEDPADVIPKLSGAWALIWFNFEDNTINFIRNSQRPLFLAFNELRDQLFWASEKWMLAAALMRDRRTIIKSEEDIFELPVDTLRSWVVPKEKEIFGAGHSDTIKGKSHSSYSYGGHSYGGVASWWDDKKENNVTSISTNVRSLKTKAEEFLTPLDLTSEELTTLFETESLCVWCHGEVSEKEIKDKTALTLPGSNIVCSDCAGAMDLTEKKAVTQGV